MKKILIIVMYTFLSIAIFGQYAYKKHVNDSLGVHKDTLNSHDVRINNLSSTKLNKANFRDSLLATESYLEGFIDIGDLQGAGDYSTTAQTNALISDSIAANTISADTLNNGDILMVQTIGGQKKFVNIGKEELGDSVFSSTSFGTNFASKIYPIIVDGVSNPYIGTAASRRMVYGNQNIWGYDSDNELTYLIETTLTNGFQDWGAIGLYRDGVLRTYLSANDASYFGNNLTVNGAFSATTYTDLYTKTETNNLLNNKVDKSAVGDSVVANQGNITITESQISDLDHYTDSDIDGNETAFNGWDKDSSNDLTTTTNFSGDVSGAYNSTVVADDSHNHVISNVDNLQDSLNAKPTFTEMRKEIGDSSDILRTYSDDLLKSIDVNPSFVPFDGVDDYVSVADNDNLDNDSRAFAYEFWLKLPSSFSASNFLVWKGTSGFAAYIATNNSLYLSKANVANWGSVSIASYLGTWVHLVFGYDGSNRVVYANSTKIMDVAQSTNLIESTSTDFKLGAENTSNLLNCDLGFMRKYNFFPTQSEITALYNSGHPELYELPDSLRGASQTGLVTDGGFDNSGSWTAGSYWTIDSGGSSKAEYDGLGVGDISQNGSITKGKIYRLSFVLSDIVTNAVFRFTDNSAAVRYIDTQILNSNGTYTYEFTASSSTTNWRFYGRNDNGGGAFSLDSMSLVQIGEVATYDARNATSYSWIDGSGNNLHGQMSGSPVVVRSEKINQIKQYKGSIAANTNTTLTSIIPKGYRIIAIRAVGSDSLTAVKIGTSSGGEQVVASTTTVGTTPKMLTLASTANDAYSESSAQTLYARHDTGASGKVMNLIFICEKVNF